MNVWWTSDTHFSHANIIKYCKRPFKSVEEMNEVLVKKWNDRVKPGDLVYFLGDFCFKNSAGGKKGEGLPVKASAYLEQLNGMIQFVAGNHEGNNSLKIPTQKIYAYYGGKSICMVHSPSHADPKVEINLVGHVHDSWKVRRLSDKAIMVNCGVDVHKFQPISFDEIMKVVAEFKRNELQKEITIRTEESGEKADRPRNIESSKSTQKLQPKEMGEQVVEG